MKSTVNIIHEVIGREKIGVSEHWTTIDIYRKCPQTAQYPCYVIIFGDVGNIEMNWIPQRKTLMDDGFLYDIPHTKIGQEGTFAIVVYSTSTTHIGHSQKETLERLGFNFDPWNLRTHQQS